MFSTPTAWPPKDHQDPMLEGVNTIDPHLFYSSPSIHSVFQAEKVRMYFIYAVGVTSILTWMFGVVSFIDAMVLALVLVVASNLVSKQVIKRKVFTKDSEIMQRNRAVLRALYDFFESPSLASSVFVNAISEEKLDIYGVRENEAIQFMKDYMLENNIGQQNCATGHSSMCAHRIPADKRAWLESPEPRTTVVKPVEQASESLGAN